MDKREYIVRHLYGEEDTAKLGGLLETDEALRREYQALSEIKFHLDQRAPRKPGEQVLDTIMQAAAQDWTPVARIDRPASPSSAVRRMHMMGWITAAMAVVLAVGISLWPGSGPGPVDAVAVQEVPVQAPRTVAPQKAAVAPQTGSIAEAGREDRAVAEATLNTDPTPVVQREQAEQTAPPLEELLAWDESEDVRRLYRQVEVLESRSSNASWGGSYTSGIVPASSTVPGTNDWDE